MTITATPIISEEIYLQDMSDDVKDLEGDCPRDEQAWVMVRQATESDNLRHEQQVATVELTHEGGKTYEKRQSNIRQEWAFETFLALHAAGNIEGPDGGPLFEFKDTGPYNRVKGTFEKFKETYGLLPGPVARAIIRAVYTINSDWDWLGISYTPEEDEEDGGNPTSDTSEK